MMGWLRWLPLGRPTRHLHIWEFEQAGVELLHTSEEILAMPLELQPSAAFAGPLVCIYRCRCGETQRRTPEWYRSHRAIEGRSK